MAAVLAGSLVAACGSVPRDEPGSGEGTALPSPNAVFRNHVAFAEGLIGGEGPYWFLIDTGASRSALDESVVDALGLAPAGTTTVEGSAGSIHARTTRVEHLSLGGLTARNLEPTVYDLSGSLAPEGQRIAGILGHDVLGGHAVLFDPRHGRLRFAERAESLADLSAAMALPFELDNGIPALAAAIDGLPVRLRLDTGASLSPGPVRYLNVTQACFDLLRLADPDLVPYTHFTASGTGGELRLPVAEARTLVLGGLEISAPHLIVQPPAGYFARPDALGFLATYTLADLSAFIVDYPAARLILIP